MSHVTYPDIARWGGLLHGCVNDGRPGSDNQAAHPVSPDGATIVYAADQDMDEQFELFLIDLAAPAIATRINGPMAPGGSVYPFAAEIGRFGDGCGFSPDGTTVVYIADQEVDELYDLYAVDVSSPGTSAKLNGPLPVNGDDRWSAVRAL